MAGFKQSFVQSLTQTSTTRKEALGAIRIEDNKVYKYVQYNQGAGAIAGTAGRAVGYYLNSGYANNIVSADVSDCIGPAGVIVATMANGEYGWIQIEGQATLSVALVSGADGNALVLSATTDGTMKVAAAVTEAVMAQAAVAATPVVALRCPW